jgi:hypothetical protein
MGVLEKIRILPEPYNTGHINDLEKALQSYQNLVEETKRLTAELDQYRRNFPIRN